LLVIFDGYIVSRFDGWENRRFQGALIVGDVHDFNTQVRRSGQYLLINDCGLPMALIS
jgi:hypothetical protein